MVSPFQRSVGSALRASVLALTFAGLAACESPEERAQHSLKAGQEMLAKGELAKAGAEFNNALKRKKDLVAAWRGLAEIEERHRNWAGLVPILRTIIEHDAN